MANLRTRENSHRVFLLSGLDGSVRRELGRKIHLLGGKYFDLQFFMAKCTHVVCGELTRSEKFLGACATGKWVLHPDYIHDSYIAGSWLDEEQYEWCDRHITNKYQVDMSLALAARRWRFMLGGAYSAFSGWKVAVIAGAKRSKVIKGLLVSGGAEVLQLRIPVRNPAKVADTLGYIFVSEHNSKSFVHLIDYGVLCIKPEFIGDFLIKDPQPDPMDYLVQVNSMEELVTEVPDPLSQDSFLMDSQRSMYLSPQKPSVSTNLDSSVSSVSSSPMCARTPCSNFTSAKERPITRSCGDKIQSHSAVSPPANKPVSKLVDNRSDLPSSENVISNKINCSKEDKSITNHDHVEVIDLTDSLEENDVGFNNECIVNDKPLTVELEDDKIIRISKRNVGKKSTTSKELIPRRKTLIQPDEIKKEIIESDITEDNVANSSAKVKCDRAVKRNLLESMTSQSIQTSTPAKTVLTGRASAKTPITKKQLLQERLNISPITKFFKHVDPNNKVTENHMNKSDITIRSTSPTLVDNKIFRLNKSEILSRPSCVEVSSESSAETNKRSEDSSAIPDNVDIELEDINYSVSTGSKHSVQAGNKLINTQTTGKELKENTKKVDFTGNRGGKDKDIKSGNNQKMTRGKQPIRKQAPDSKGDRKRKSTDMTAEEVSQNEGPAEKKRVTRSSPAKNKDFVMMGGLDQSPSVHGLTTILISPSKKKSPMRRQLAESGDTIATKPVNKNIQMGPAVNNDSENFGKDVSLEIGRKRKSNHTELEHVLTHIKRKKMGFSEWCSSSLMENLRETEDVPESVAMPTTTAEIFMATLEDGFTLEALDYLESQVTFKYYPQSDIIIELIRNVLLKAEEEALGNKAYNILSRMLMLHPPITSSLQEVYLRALAGCKIGEDRPVGAEWNFIYQCINDILTSDDAVIKRNNRLLFKFVIELLQYNIQHFQSTNMSHDYNMKHMLLRIMWSPSYHVVFNKRCRTLLHMMSDVILLYQSVNCQMEKKCLLETLDGILWMIAMVTDCCRVHDTRHLDALQVLQADRTSECVHEISRKLIEVNVRDSFLLDTIIHGLQLPWLRVGVCQQLLNMYDDYLLMEEKLTDTKTLSFLVIVSRYMFLLPVFDVRSRTPGCRSPAKQRQKEVNVNHSPATVRKCLKENTDINKGDKIVLKAMKKNHKGETPLHVACIRNDVITVKNLLKIPGINVNATDNVGWTPLHEASNHGNTECVRELLKFIPSKTMDAFFTKDHTECRKVDLLAVNGEGITPLHDAVLNNKPEVCQILLQHGGSKLLEARTCLGYTPLDLAETDEMITLLSSYSIARKKHNDSLTLLGSQESTSSIEDSACSVPSDVLYEEVMYVEGDRVYANIKSTTRYIHLVTLLVKCYIHVRNLHLICRCMKDKQLLQNISDDNSLCDSGSQKENSAENSVGHGSRCQNYNKMMGLDKKIVSSQCYTQDNNQSGMISNRNTCRERSAPAVSCVDMEEVNSVRNDLKQLRKFPQYLNLFRNHLLKLCRSEDHKLVKEEMQDLYYMTEGLF